jgi:ElaB/YqjD/DUF883 family membrane-anchored ribosome-binding protein
MAEAPQVLAPERLGDFIDEREREAFERLVDPATRLRQQIEEAVAGLRSLADTLDSATVKEAAYGAPRATVQSSKDMLVRKFRSLSDNFQAPVLEQFADLSALKSTAEQVMAQAGDAAATHGRPLRLQFAPQLRDLKSKLRQLQGAITDLEALMGQHRAAFDGCAKLRVEAARMTELQAEHARVAQRLTTAGESAVRLETEELGRQERLAQLLASPAYAAHRAQHHQVEALRAELRRVQQRFESEFALFTKPLRKFGYVVGLEKNDRQLLDGYLEAAWRTFTMEGGHRLLGLLAELAQAIGSGRVEVKEPQKTQQRIERWVAEVPRYLAEHARLQEQIGVVEAGSAHELTVEVEALQRESAETTRRLEDERMERTRLTSEQTRLRQELDTARRAFEATVRTQFGQAVRLEPPADSSAGPSP